MPFMTRPELREIEISQAEYHASTMMFTMAPGEWNTMLEQAYSLGAVLLELDDSARPVKAFRRCACELCQAEHN
jgi:hypothetical protein